MKTFYVLWNGVKYLSDTKFVPFGLEKAYFWHESMGNAHQFDTLPQALDFIDSSGLSLDVLKVEISYAYSRDLFTNKLPK